MRRVQGSTPEDNIRRKPRVILPRFGHHFGGDQGEAQSHGVKLIGKEKSGAAYVTVIVLGDVSAVKAAIESGQRAGAPLGKIIAAHVIARPHEDLAALLPG